MDDSHFAALKGRIRPLERFVAAFERSLLPPTMSYGSRTSGFRYRAPDVRHFCLLKAAASVSALNACAELVKGGYNQEVKVLVRTIIDFTTHIEFVLFGRDANGVANPEVTKYLTDFFADCARDSSAEYKKAQVRQKRVHEVVGGKLDTITELMETPPTRSTQVMMSDIYLTFSNYVHAKYPEAMELYGASPGHFHLWGFRGTPVEREAIDLFECYIDAASLTLRHVVQQLGLRALINDDPELAAWVGS
jgi:hypothetical protein